MAPSNDPLAHRKSSSNLVLLNPEGNPLANQEVEIRMLRHKFLFGTTGFNFLMPLDHLQGKQRELAEIHQASQLELMNAMTLPFYWGRYEPEEGKPDTERMMRAAKYLKSKGMLLKGHPLCWHTVCADWLMKYDNAEILRKQLARIDRDVTIFKGVIDMWDVINEVVIMPVFDKYDNAMTRVCKQIGRIQMVREVFQAARSANPAATLLLNDFDMSDAYDILVLGCLEAGIQIDVIGLQSHMHQGYWGVKKTQRILERFSFFKKPLHFTETNIVSGHLMPPEIVDLNDYQVSEWPSTPEGEERQAREALTHYKLLFEHPLVESVTWWDFSDGGWLHAPAGLVRQDGSRKPAYDELLRHIKGEWWTKPQRALTDAQGRVQVSGFLGDYEVVYAGRRAQFKLDRQNPVPLTVQL